MLKILSILKIFSLIFKVIVLALAIFIKDLNTAYLIGILYIRTVYLSLETLTKMTYRYIRLIIVFFVA